MRSGVGDSVGTYAVFKDVDAGLGGAEAEAGGRHEVLKETVSGGSNTVEVMGGVLRRYEEN